MKLIARLSFLLACTLLCTSITFGGGPIAQESGVPGDGIPDIYYDPVTGQMDVDTDGTDMVALLISGPDAREGCNLCDAMSPDPSNDLPGSMPDLSDFSSWTLGFIDGATQWIRGNPLEGTGFRGVIADNWIDIDDNTNPWPADIGVFVNFPTEGLGIANYGPGLTIDDFPGLYDDGTGEALWSVSYANDAGQVFLTNVTVPEPASLSLLGLAGLALLGLRRRS